MWLVYASSAAICFGFRGILYQWTSQRPMNRNVMLCGVYLCGTLTALIANAFAAQQWTPGVLAGLLMGVFSFASNGAMYKGFAVGKASLVAIFTALAPVVSALAAYALWGETLSGGQTAAFLIITAGILLIRYSNDLSFKNWQGVEWALLAMLFFGLTDVCTKLSTLWHAETLPTLAMMYATGTLLFGVWAAKDWAAHQAHRQAAVRAAAFEATTAERPANAGTDRDVSPESPRADVGPATAAGAGAARDEVATARVSVRPPKLWSFKRAFAWGMCVGTTNITGMLLAVPAFRHGITGLVSAVIAMNVLIVLLYARLFLREKFRKLELAGMVCAIAGMIMLKLLG